MNFLNAALSQVGELFRSMTPGARITAGLLLAVVVISLVFLLKQGAGSPDDYLFGGEPFSLGELSSMEAAFDKAGLRGYQVEGAKIRVPRSQRAAYMGALAENNAMPNDLGSFLRKSMDKGGMFMDRNERQERTKLALQDTLSNIIRHMTGIDKAIVIYDKETKGGLSKKTIATASVSVQPTGNQPLEASSAKSIRHLVAGAINGLSPQQITITDFNGGSFPASDGEGQLGVNLNKYLDIQKQHEDHLRKEFSEFLQNYKGLRLVVNVELDRTLTEQSRETDFLKEKSIPIEIFEKTEEQTSSSSGPNGQPGTVSNANGAAALGSSLGSPTSSTTKSDNRQKVVPGGKQTVTQLAGLTPKRVTVLINIPKSHYENIYRKENKIEDPDEELPSSAAAAIKKKFDDDKKSLELMISNVIIADKKVLDTRKQVTVNMYDDLEPEEIPEETFSDKAIAIAGDYWSTIGMTMLGLFSLLVLKSVVRATPSEGLAQVSTQSHDEDDDDEEEESVDEKTEHERQLKRGIHGPSMQEELSELVRDDPDTAAKILKGWIASAT